MGQHLIAVKADLEHGQFLPWLDAEFGWSERSARKFMSIAEMVKSAKLANLEGVQPSALYVRSAESTPEAVRRSGLELAAEEAPVRRADVTPALSEHERDQQRVTANAERWRSLVNLETGELLNEDDEVDDLSADGFGSQHPLHRKACEHKENGLQSMGGRSSRRENVYQMCTAVKFWGRFECVLHSRRRLQSPVARSRLIASRRARLSSSGTLAGSISSQP